MATPPANPPRMADFDALDMTSEKDMGSVFLVSGDEEDISLCCGGWQKKCRRLRSKGLADGVHRLTAMLAGPVRMACLSTHHTCATHGRWTPHDVESLAACFMPAQDQESCTCVT